MGSDKFDELSEWRREKGFLDHPVFGWLIMLMILGLVVFFDLYDFKNHRVKWPGVEQQKEKDKQELIRLHNERLIALQEERIQEERRRMEGIIKEDANHCLPRW